MGSKNAVAFELTVRIVLLSLLPLFLFLWLGMPIWLYSVICFCLNTVVLFTTGEDKMDLVFGADYAGFGVYGKAVVVIVVSVIFTLGMVGLTLLNF